MNDIRVISMQLPGSVRAFTVRKDDYYTIIMRDDLSMSDRLKAYRHEVDHIRNGDYDSHAGAELIEVYAHGLAEGV